MKSQNLLYIKVGYSKEADSYKIYITKLDLINGKATTNYMNQDSITGFLPELTKMILNSVPIQLIFEDDDTSKMLNDAIFSELSDYSNLISISNNGCIYIRNTVTPRIDDLIAKSISYKNNSLDVT